LALVQGDATATGIGLPDAGEILLSMIGDSEWVVRSAAVTGVAELTGRPGGIPLTSLPESLLFLTLTLTGGIPLTSLPESLLLVGSDPDSDVRHSVLVALATPEAWIKAQDMEETALSAIGSMLATDRSTRVRAAAAFTLAAAAAGMGTESAQRVGVEHLVACLANPREGEEVLIGVGQGLAILVPDAFVKDPLVDAFRRTRSIGRLLYRFPLGSLLELREATEVLSLIQKSGKIRWTASSQSP